VVLLAAVFVLNGGPEFGIGLGKGVLLGIHGEIRRGMESSGF
jgi:hypothetical protein